MIGSALRALGSIERLLKSVGCGNPVDGNEFDRVIKESYAAFVASKLITNDRIAAPSPSTSVEDATSDWCIPDWCVDKLYEGMAQLVQAASATREE